MSAPSAAAALIASTALSRASVRMAAALGSAMLLEVALWMQRCDRSGAACPLLAHGRAVGRQRGWSEGGTATLYLQRRRGTGQYAINAQKDGASAGGASWRFHGSALLRKSPPTFRRRRRLVPAAGNCPSAAAEGGVGKGDGKTTPSAGVKSSCEKGRALSCVLRRRRRRARRRPLAN